MQYYGNYLKKLSEKLPLFFELMRQYPHLIGIAPEAGAIFSQAHYAFWKEALLEYAPQEEIVRLFSGKRGSHLSRS